MKTLVKFYGAFLIKMFFVGVGLTCAKIHLDGISSMDPSDYADEDFEEMD